MGCLLDMCVTDGELTQPEPSTVANRSPRIFITIEWGSSWGDSHHLSINRRSRTLIFKII
jgi:hypothetical protein